MIHAWVLFFGCPNSAVPVLHAMGMPTALANDADAVRAMKSVVDTDQSALDLSMKSRAAGNTSDLEIEAAHRTLAQTQLKLEEALTQQYLDVTRLFVALGGSPLSTLPQ